MADAAPRRALGDIGNVRPPGQRAKSARRTAGAPGATAPPAAAPAPGGERPTVGAAPQPRSTAPAGGPPRVVGTCMMGTDCRRCSSQSPCSDCQPPSPRLDAQADRRDELCFSAYAPVIMRHLRQREGKQHSVGGYMARQPDINEKMRGILMDWLVDVHLKFKLNAEVLYLAANLVDRYLFQVIVKRQQLQLVGVVAMFIACKYEEIFPPEVKDFVHISAKTYTREEVLKMERHMLCVLNFIITVPTPFPFLERGVVVCRHSAAAKAAVADVGRLTHVAHFIGECSLLRLIAHKPSMVAASCLLVARKLLAGSPVTRNVWTPDLVHYTGYTAAELVPCAREVFEQFEKCTTPAGKLQALRKKYSHTKFGEVANPDKVPLHRDSVTEFLLHADADGP